jgi:aldehyde dehydrogenase (NAD+)
MVNIDYIITIDNLFECHQVHKYSPLPVQERLSILKRLRKVILQFENEIYDALSKDLNKSTDETFIIEYMTVLMELDLFIKNLSKWSTSYKCNNSIFFLGSKARLELSPMGQVLIITPWNYPFQLPMIHLIAAFAAGNSVILKPSEFTPKLSQVLNSIISEVFQPIHVALIEGGAEVTQYLMTLPFDHVHFTGSTAVGKLIMEAASKHLMKCTLELGGKSPCIIDENYDIKDAVHQLFVGKFINAGQTCIAPDYVFVPQHSKLEFIQLLKNTINTFVAQRENLDNFVRIINHKNFDRLIDYIDTAKLSGAEIIVEGVKDRNSRLLGPTIISNIPETHPLLNEEIFGPILPVVYYDDIHSIIRFIQQRNKPLALYVFSNSTRFTNQIKHSTSSGAFVVNSLLLHIMHPELPFGGVNHSGMGQSTGYFGFKEFSHERPVLKVNKWLNPIKFMNLPMPNSLIKILRKIL